MLHRNIYYSLKPFLPRPLRMAVRRQFAKRTLAAHRDVWPIDEAAGRKPEGWPGWPDAKQFAFVLTHDVEGPDGLEKVRPLAELEMRHGFRSSFNFIPEGPYSVPLALRTWLVDNGFEVCVHDLNHDGKLYQSRESFTKSALRINRYLREWGAVGYRSGFMFHNLEWHHDLDILYDSSTFDTDPFEPQPDGVGTIFPFFVPRHEERKGRSGKSTGPRGPVCGWAERAKGKEQNDFRSSAAPPSPLPLLSSRGNAAPSSLPLTPLRAEGVPSPLPLATLRQSDHPRAGYVELPYTLPQDSTLYFLLRETAPDIWLRKLDWIAERGGMALLNVHPDYVAFGDASSATPDDVVSGRSQEARDPDPLRISLTPGPPQSTDGPREVHARTSYPLPRSARTFDVRHYEALLRHVAVQYRGKYWHALPRDVARFAGENRVLPSRSLESNSAVHLSRILKAKHRIWIDLENTPHIPFFNPIIRELKARGHDVVLTARDAYQTCELATLYKFRFKAIGRHYGKVKLMKFIGVLLRSAQLVPFALRHRPSLSLNHGSRTQCLASNILGIPTVGIMDYEHASELPLLTPRWEIAPDVIPDDACMPGRKGRLLKYAGLKEDVYAPDLKVDPGILPQLHLNGRSLVVTVRPPASEAHYHNPEAEVLLEAFMQRLIAVPDARAVLLPRNHRQEVELRRAHPEWFNAARTVVPKTVVDGMNLLWHSDLVVSGGGTMNREAAALGVPVYSIFRGKIGAVDKSLQTQGRLTLIESVDDVHTKIRMVPRSKPRSPAAQPRRALSDIIGHIEDILAFIFGDRRASRRLPRRDAFTDHLGTKAIKVETEDVHEQVPAGR